MSALQELPELVDGGEDESQAEELVEEEFDLADILGEEVSGAGSKEELLKKVEEELKVNFPDFLQQSVTSLEGMWNAALCMPAPLLH